MTPASAAGTRGPLGLPRRGVTHDGAMVQMGEEEFEILVGEALDSIPQHLLDDMNNVVILIEPRHPTESLYGLYQGVALTERTANYAGHLPDTITIYREPILAHASTLDEVREQVRITVIHEIAHHFGIDDQHLGEWGWA